MIKLSQGCDHPDLQVAPGYHCNLCYGSVRFCPDCTQERLEHEFRCPEDTGFQERNPTYIKTEYWKDIPLHIRLAPTSHGLQFESLRRGFYAIFVVGDLSEDVIDWLSSPPAVPGIEEDRLSVIEAVMFSDLSLLP